MVMPMSFESDVKGRSSEALFCALLQNCGYRVIPLGVEHSVRELTELARTNRPAHRAVPQSLRHLPDFLVLDLAPERLAARVVEVKYRATWDAIKGQPNTLASLTCQAKTWGAVDLVLFLGTPYRAATTENMDAAATNRCRVFRLGATGDALHVEALADRPMGGHGGYFARLGDVVPFADFQWLHGEPLQRVFTQLEGTAADRTIQKATDITKAIHDVLS
jgi:hypothetical protein